MGKGNKDLIAVGEMVIVRFRKVKKENPKTASGIEIISPGKEEADVHEAIVETIGGSVPDTVEFKIGDSIVFNEHDCKMFAVENKEDSLNPIDKGIMRYSSIWAIYK